VSKTDNAFYMLFLHAKPTISADFDTFVSVRASIYAAQNKRW